MSPEYFLLLCGFHIHYLNRAFVLIKFFDFEVIIDSHGVLTHHTERSWGPYTIDSVVICCRVIVLCYSQGPDTDATKTEHLYHDKGPSCCPFIAKSLTLGTTNLFSLCIVLSFQECCINGSYVTTGD